MTRETYYAGSGIGFFNLLQLLFIGLKLGKVIDWSWFWVLSPLIFEASIVVIFLLIIIFVVLIKTK